MQAIEFDLPDEAATAALGVRFAPLLRPGDVVCLSGPLGAGKTTLARGLIWALTGEGEAPSPTFGLVAVYDAGKFQLAHFDLYRITKPDEIWELGFEDSLLAGVSLIEWPERITGFIPDHALAVRLDHSGRARRARLLGGGDWPERLRSAGLAQVSESPKTRQQ